MTKVADCGPLGIKTSLASAHLAIDHSKEKRRRQNSARNLAPFSTRRTLQKAGRRRRKAESRCTGENKPE